LHETGAGWSILDGDQVVTVHHLAMIDREDVILICITDR
jgi:hypothetical protein